MSKASSANDKNLNAITAIEASTPTTSTCTGAASIQYKLVEEKVGKHKRFAAFETVRTSNTKKILKPVSIQEWVEYMNNSSSNRSDAKCTTNTNNSINNNTNYHRKEFTTFIQQSTSQYDAYFFETKGTSFQNANDKQFEFVLVNSENLSSLSQIGGPTPDVFEEHLDCLPPNETCCAFPNLGNTAILIAPKDTATVADHNNNESDEKNGRDYSHIGTFMRNAPENEIDELWRKVAKEYLDALRGTPSKSLWLSTSGLGVSWLHFRIDSRPKYYTYSAFKRER